MSLEPSFVLSTAFCCGNDEAACDGVAVRVLVIDGVWVTVGLWDGVRIPDAVCEEVAACVDDCVVDMLAVAEGVSDCDAVASCDIDCEVVWVGVAVPVPESDWLAVRDWLGVTETLPDIAWDGLCDGLRDRLWVGDSDCDGDVLIDGDCELVRDTLGVCDCVCEGELLCEGDTVVVDDWVMDADKDCEGVRVILFVCDWDGDVDAVPVCVPVPELVGLRDLLGVGEHACFRPEMRMPRNESSELNDAPPSSEAIGLSACAKPLTGTPARARSFEAYQSSWRVDDITTEMYWEITVSTMILAGRLNCTYVAGGADTNAVALAWANSKTGRKVVASALNTETVIDINPLVAAESARSTSGRM
jgi:hypothetical protein